MQSKFYLERQNFLPNKYSHSFLEALENIKFN